MIAPTLRYGAAVVALGLFPVGARDIFEAVGPGETETSQIQERPVQILADGGIAISTGGASRIVVGPMIEPFDTVPALFIIAELESLRATGYPAALRESGVGGAVLVGVNVHSSGAVVGARVDRSSGLEPLDNSALQVARIMRFEHGAADSQSSPVWTSVPIRFEIVQGAQ